MAISNVQEKMIPGDQEKKWVALTSVLAAVFLTSMKLVVGIVTGSLGILSEAAHSGLDLVAALVTFFAVRISGRPADARHTYGYGKIENLSALFETVLLLVTCVWIIYEAIQRLFFKSIEVEASLWAFLIMGVSILIDFGRSRALSRTAKKYDSQALEADALHFSTDIWSSSVVIAGLFLVLLSERLGIPWLAKADAVAAIGVAGIVIYVSVQLGRKTIVGLLDAIPAGLHDEAMQAAHVPGVQQVKRVRIRRSGPETFADVTLLVDRNMALERAREVAIQAKASVEKILPGADVVVDVVPGEAEEDGIHSTIRRTANRHGLGVHGMRLYKTEDGRRSLELHVEVSERLSLDEAHEKATHLERALQQVPLDLDEVVVHIEPVGEATVIREATPADQARILQALQDLQDEIDVPCQAHDIKVHRIGDELSVSFHCLMDGQVSIGTAHDRTEQVERLLRNRIPKLGRVIIHTENVE